MFVAFLFSTKTSCLLGLGYTLLISCIRHTNEHAHPHRVHKHPYPDTKPHTYTQIQKPSHMLTNTHRNIQKHTTFLAHWAACAFHPAVRLLTAMETGSCAQISLLSAVGGGVSACTLRLVRGASLSLPPPPHGPISLVKSLHTCTAASLIPFISPVTGSTKPLLHPGLSGKCSLFLVLH